MSFYFLLQGSFVPMFPFPFESCLFQTKLTEKGLAKETCSL